MIIDDSESPANITTIPFIAPLLNWMRNNKHEWRVSFGPKLGPHKCHQLALEQARSNLILRVDDDCTLSPNLIEELVKNITELDHCAAISGLVLDPGVHLSEQFMPQEWQKLNEFSGKIWEDDKGKPCHSPALQWCVHRDKEIKEVQHLHSTFLYKKAVALAVNGWSDMNLSKVGMTEETWFTYKIHRAGWKMHVNPNIVSWHMKAPSGGCRSDKDKEDLSKLYFDDRHKFEEWYKGTKK